MADTPVVLVAGPRQAGKTTLVRELADDDIRYLTLDDENTLAAASEDPTGFIRDLDRAIIDEIQRAPALLLAIKKSIDEDRRPGRFLLTGSANVMTIPKVADSLAGRMETLTLLPFAQCEMSGQGGGWLESVFSGKPPAVSNGVVGRDLIETVVSGGYPEVLARTAARRRKAWIRQYLDALIRRDIREMSNIHKVENLPRFLEALAAVAGQLCNYSKIGGQVGLTSKTVDTYMALFEQMYLLQRVTPWAANRLKRMVKTPKMHFNDTGVLSHLSGLTADVTQKNRGIFGNVLESFVYGELRKLASFSDDGHRIYHYRDTRQREVDFVMEDEAGRIAGIEVKASATVTAADFKGMRELAEAGGDDFVLGMVLYDGEETLPFGDRMYAVPISSLWRKLRPDVISTGGG
jgi:hypothetical protein